MVIATQNPIDHQGTFVLPEAQLDRFLFCIKLGYPSESDELKVLKRHASSMQSLRPCFEAIHINQIQHEVEEVFVHDEVLHYIVSLARFTRGHPQVELGVSPRAALALMQACKAKAWLYERDYVIPEDVQDLAEKVFAHRLTLNAQAEIQGVSNTQVVQMTLNQVPHRTH